MGQNWLDEKMKKKLKTKVQIYARPICIIFSVFRRKKYKKIHTFCSFIGYSRSGHTLIGSLLDAHPNIVISTEADAFNLIKLGYGKDALLYYLEVWSKLVSRLLRNKWSGYDYYVKGAYQGMSDSISVIGDKQGTGTLTSIFKNPELPRNLQEMVRIPVKYLHVIRNPYDTISTMHNRNHTIANTTNQGETTENRKFSRKLLRKCVKMYFKKATHVQRLIEEGEMEIMDIYHEDLISSPEETLKSIFSFLGVETEPDLLKNCASIIYKNPNKSRHSIPWPKPLKGIVQTRNSNIPFLKDYSFS